ncbi:MAG: protein translocase subunit SecD [Blastocatellia bacterium AA13]|nr:MAG: protein translocase subunit SecD [Blastocatellia bacterium AA13]
MRGTIQRRTIIIVAVTLVSLYLVVMPHDRWPGASDFTSWSTFKGTLSKNIHLGLDLRGGTHLVMQVQANDVIKAIATKSAEAAKAKLQEKGWSFNDVKVALDEVTITVPESTHNADIIDELKRDFNQNTLSGQGWTNREVGNSIIFKLLQDEENRLREKATDQAMQIIDNRINAFGIAENTLQRHGANDQYQILLQMPGNDDPERIKNTLNADSNLELKPVPKSAQLSYPTKEAAEAAMKTLGPPDTLEIVRYRDRSAGEGGGLGDGWSVVEKNPVVTGFDMRDASAVPAQSGSDNFQIKFSLTVGGAQRFGDWTGKHIKDHLAIVLNNEVKSAPEIEAQIHDQGQITGSFTKKSAEDLALVLRSGALPAKVIYLEERTVGPSLGADSIRRGVTASVAGLVAVVMFMLWYYRLSGVNAVLALLLNLILLLAALVVFGATLTLPGIAGVILTIGMAVDSNVLIFERIREEMRNGKVVASAVDLGFGKAFQTIIDTHVTTVVSAIFLFVFGTGPIRGFAVTLVAGLLANLFTAVFVSRTIFMWHLNRSARVESLSI